MRLRPAAILPAGGGGRCKCCSPPLGGGVLTALSQIIYLDLTGHFDAGEKKINGKEWGKEKEEEGRKELEKTPRK